MREAMFFSYASPEPPGFAERAPFYDREASLCLLPYAAVRAAADPDAMLLDFFQRTYDAVGWTGTK